MKAITYTAYGTPDILALTEVPEPKVGPGEVLVRVRAAGVNPVDWKLAAGYLDSILEVRYPVIPGWDVAGVVEAVGEDTFDYAVGDEVYGYVRKEWVELGTYAELVSAPVRTLARKPRELTFEQAAGIPLAGLTAYQSLTRVGLEAGETVLIHSAAGGTGSFGVQIAVALGLRVIGTAGAHNHDYLRSLGAEPVLYGEGFADRVRELAPEGVDAALGLLRRRRDPGAPVPGQGGAPGGFHRRLHRGRPGRAPAVGPPGHRRPDLPGPARGRGPPHRQRGARPAARRGGEGLGAERRGPHPRQDRPHGLSRGTAPSLRR